MKVIIFVVSNLRLKSEWKDLLGRHYKNSYKLLSSIIQWQSPLCVKLHWCFKSVVQQHTCTERWTRWPAMCGTLCWSCATQLSILILRRMYMMREDTCLCGDLNYELKSTAQLRLPQTHRFTINLCSLIAVVSMGGLVSKLHYWLPAVTVT